MTNIIMAALRRAFTPKPEVPEVPDTPTKRRGAEAYNCGERRRPPVFASPQETIEWLAGWDEEYDIWRQW